METVNRKTIVYRIDLKRKWTNKDLTDSIILKDILTGFFTKNLNKDGQGKSKFQVPKQYKMYWISSYILNKDIIKVTLNYSIYNQFKDIINVNTGKKTKQKEKNEGDREKQHLLIKIYPKTNKAVLVFEHIGISATQLRNDIRDYIIKNVENQDMIQLHIEPLPDKDFVNELLKMKKISTVRVIVDREECTIDEDILFSEDNISRKEVEISYKPTSKLSFGIGRVKGFYENYLGNDNKKRKIKRIIIDGSKSNGKLRLDTEGMKLSRYISTNLDVTGQVDSEEILDAYEMLVKKEFEKYINDVILINFNEGDCDVEESQKYTG